MGRGRVRVPEDGHRQSSAEDDGGPLAGGYGQGILRICQGGRSSVVPGRSVSGIFGMQRAGLADRLWTVFGGGVS